MLAELSMILLGRGTQLSGDLGRILKIIDESGIRYKLTPSGTCIEGEWDEVMDLVKKCHREARSFCTCVLTTIRIQDESGAYDKLEVATIEAEVGPQLISAMKSVRQSAAQKGANAIVILSDAEFPQKAGKRKLKVRRISYLVIHRR